MALSESTKVLIDALKVTFNRIVEALDQVGATDLSRKATQLMASIEALAEAEPGQDFIDKNAALRDAVEEFIAIPLASGLAVLGAGGGAAILIALGNSGDSAFN